MRVDITAPEIAATDIRWTGDGPTRRDSLAHLDVDPWTGWDGGAAPLVQIDTPKDTHHWVRIELAPHDARKLAAALLEAANAAEPEADRCAWSVAYLPSAEPAE